MRKKYAFHSVLVVFVFMTGILVGHFRVFGQASQSADPIFGTWKMDLARSVSILSKVMMLALKTYSTRGALL